MVFKDFSLSYTIINFLLASFKLLNNFENACLNPPENSLRMIGQCSHVPSTHWLQGKCARINLTQAAFGKNLQNHRRLPVSIFLNVKIATLGSLKRVTGMIFKLVSNFKGAS
jgi:hypothetical protein